MKIGTKNSSFVRFSIGFGTIVLLKFPYLLELLYDIGFCLQEKDLQLIRETKLRQQMLDREESLRRARRDASLADGISWGMGEDAIEEDEVYIVVKFFFLEF